MQVNDIGCFLQALAKKMDYPIAATDGAESNLPEQHQKNDATKADVQTDDLLGWDLSVDGVALTRKPYRVTVHSGEIGVHQGSLFSLRFDWKCSQQEKYRLLARITDEKDDLILRDMGHTDLSKKIAGIRKSMAITNPQKLLELGRADREAFFDALDSNWLSVLEMAGSGDAGLDDLVEEYASSPEDYSVGSLLRTYNGNFPKERADDLDFGEGGELTERELAMLRRALERKHHKGEIEYEVHFTCTYDFACGGGEYTAFFSGPLSQGGFEWNLDSIRANLRKV